MKQNQTNQSKQKPKPKQTKQNQTISQTKPNQTKMQLECAICYEPKRQLRKMNCCKNQDFCGKCLAKVTKCPVCRQSKNKVHEKEMTILMYHEDMRTTAILSNMDPDMTFREFLEKIQFLKNRHAGVVEEDVVVGICLTGVYSLNQTLRFAGLRPSVYKKTKYVVQYEFYENE